MRESKGFKILLFLFLSHQLLAQKAELVEASLRDIRDPLVLDSLAEGLLRFEDDSVALGRAFFLKGLAGTYSASPEKAAKYFRSSLRYLKYGEVYDRRFSYQVVLKNLGISYYRLHRYASGDSAFRKLKSLALKQGDSLKYALAIKSMANALMIQERYDSATALMKESTLILQKLEYRGIASSYLSLGSIYGRMSQEKEALKWFRKALAYSVYMNDKRMRGRVYNNIAVAHRGLENFDSANFYLQEALQIHQDLGSIMDQVEVFANLSRNYARLNQWEKAELNLNKAWAILPDNDKRAGRSRTSLWLLSLQVANHKRDMEGARPYFDSLYHRMPRSRWIKNPKVLDAFATYFEQMGQGDSAIKYLRLSKDRQQELQAQRTAEGIKRAGNEMELAALKREKDGQLRGYQLAILVIGVFGLLGFLWLQRSRRKVKTIQAERMQPNEIAGLKMSHENFSLLEPHKTEVQEKEPSPQLKLKSKAVIKIKEILYLESDGHYVNIHLSGRPNPEVERSSLKAMAEQIESYDFVRIHRSYIINGNSIKAVYANKVLLENGAELPLSRTYKDSLKQRFEAGS